MTQSSFGHRGRMEAVAFVPGGRRVLSAASDGHLRLSDLRSGAEVRCLDHDPARIAAVSVALSPDERWGLTSFGDGSLRLWDTASGTPVLQLADGTGHAHHIARFALDGRVAVSTSFSTPRRGRIHLWDLEVGRELCCLDPQLGRIKGISVSPDGQYVATCVGAGAVWLWRFGDLLEARTRPSKAGFGDQDSAIDLEQSAATSKI